MTNTTYFYSAVRDDDSVSTTSTDNEVSQQQQQQQPTVVQAAAEAYIVSSSVHSAIGNACLACTRPPTELVHDDTLIIRSKSEGGNLVTMRREMLHKMKNKQFGYEGTLYCQLYLCLLIWLSDFMFVINSKFSMLKDSTPLSQVKAGFGSSASNTGRVKSKMSGTHVTHGFHLIKGKSIFPMEDYLVARFKQVYKYNLGLFAIFDGHLGHGVPDYLQSHLFNNILIEPDFWTETETAIKRAYRATDKEILDKAVHLGRGGSTAVTAILIDGQKLVVANVGDARAVICKNGMAKQLSVDHEPSKEQQNIESRGGFVSNIPGDVPRVDGLLAVARAFGYKGLKMHLSSEPDVAVEMIDDTEFLIMASDGLWKVMSNQEAVDSIRNKMDAQSAAKYLAEEAISRKSEDDISCIVVRFSSPRC
ncbi:hypothetical protein IFM89_027214 [Coptis chinensis]|uniref:protein-serine/threonine phosphatase n=1 Tax=Coptis chinensis TaxID=261450 RepID=A0A835GZB9_9MAGN|nr:hypothetical protein IFM89_027214 [Coptis chinensis]